MNGRRSALGTLGASAALAAVLALAGCASSGTGSNGTGDGMGHDEHATAGADATSEANAADIMFAQMMLPHHEQALEMSGIVLAKDGVDADVAELAEQIEAAQGPEIEQLESWLDEWGAPAGGNDMAMDGMLSEAELDELEAADGASASQLFLEQMIAHHEGAVAMAEEHLENGAHEGALAMSEAIIESQTTEIAQMREMLAG
jgi:uncharacterized protein (DUF305 family)